MGPTAEEPMALVRHCVPRQSSLPDIQSPESLITHTGLIRCMSYYQ